MTTTYLELQDKKEAIEIIQNERIRTGRKPQTPQEVLLRVTPYVAAYDISENMIAYF